MVKIIDLSSSIREKSPEPQPPKIKFINHKKGAFLLGLSSLFKEKFSFKKLFTYIFKLKFLKPSDFPDNLGLAWEKVTLSTHSGTHLDSPYHYGPISERKSARTIDQIPLDWCYSDGVVLDLKHKKPDSEITVEDIKSALGKIKYKIKEKDIVLIMTGASKNNKSEDYLTSHPGVNKKTVIWLVEQGVKIIGTDGWGFDKSFTAMIKKYSKTGNKEDLWPAHIVGREHEYCHIEQLANLDKIPKPYGFKVACFPIKIEKAGAAWARVVAIMKNQK